MRVPWYAERGPAALAPAVAGWEFSMRRVDRFARHLRPDQMLDVRYEDLVRDPDAELQRICDFAALRGDSAVDEMISRPRGGFVPAWHENVPAPLNPGLVDSWRERLEPHQIALVEHAVRPYLDRFGYLRDESVHVPPQQSDLRRLAANRVRRAIRWRRYTVGELKRRALHRQPVAAERA